MSNNATPSELKNGAGLGTSRFAKKNGLTNLKSQVDKLNIDKLAELDPEKLKSVPGDLPVP